MTAKELFEQIRHLGGRRTLVNIENNVVFTAVNRALFEVNRLFPVTERIRLLNFPIAPVAFYKGITVHKGGEDLEFHASGIKSLAFAISGGAGKVTVCRAASELVEEESYEWEQLTSFEEKSFVIDELALTDVIVKFSGVYNFLVKDLSMYADVLSDNPDDVKMYSPWVEYDMASVEYAGARFMSFSGAPVKSNTVTLESPNDYKIEGTKVFLRADMPGEYEVEIMTQPEHIVNEDETPVDINPQLQDLIPLRAAYYLYSATDTEIADRCNAEYQRMIAIALANVRKVKTQSRYRNVLKGW